MSVVLTSPTLLGSEDTVWDTQAWGRKMCHRPSNAVGLDYFCVIKEGFLEEVVSHWAVKEESDAQGRGDY